MPSTETEGQARIGRKASFNLGEYLKNRTKNKQIKQYKDFVEQV